MTRASKPPADEQSVLRDLHVPSGPPSGAPLDAAFAQLRDAQVAAAENAAGLHSAETFLSIETQVPYADQIDDETRLHQADSLGPRDASDLLGTGMAHAVKRAQLTRPAPEGETELERSFRTSPLPKVTAALATATERREAIEGDIAAVESYLDGSETDGSGVNLAARVPLASAQKYKRVMWAKKGAFILFELGILYFTLRLATRTEPGPLQIPEEIIETICLVGMSALIALVLPNLIAHAVSYLHPHPKAIAPRSRVAAWAMVTGLVGLGLLFAVLLAVLRAGYLFGGITSGSALPLDYLWFFAISMVWLVAPGAVVFYIVRSNSYWNHYILDLIELREKLPGLSAIIDAANAEIELRNDEILLQEESRRLAIEEHDAHRTMTLPISAAHRKSAYLEEVARLGGSPYLTESIIEHRRRVTTDAEGKFADPLADVIAARGEREAARPSLGVDLTREQKAPRLDPRAPQRTPATHSRLATTPVPESEFAR